MSAVVVPLTKRRLSPQLAHHVAVQVGTLAASGFSSSPSLSQTPLTVRRSFSLSAAVHKTSPPFKTNQDLTGTADICNTAKDFGKLHANSYLLPGEDIMFAFESAKEEFAFTNEALIMTLGENATTTRKLVQRATYRDCPISDVLFETTGRVDRDCEIKFKIGEYAVSIDIARKEEEFVKGFYKTLLLLAREQKSPEKGLDEAADSLKIMSGHDLVSQASGAAAWLENAFNQPLILNSARNGNTNSAIKGLASDIAGTTGICDVSRTYREILYVLQSVRQEFAFTNRALIKVSAETSTTTRKLVRVDGVVDRDCELEFKIGEEKFKIDIERSKEEEIKGFYKALWELVKEAMATAKDTVRLSDADRQSLNQQSDETLSWMKAQYERTHPHCYKNVIKSVLDASQAEQRRRNKSWHSRCEPMLVQ
ncbi:Bacterial Pleckstrin homology domain [Phytophthora cactorum]|nr:Bacterial Pleckstrin homology domain [Phytophthora cactorum]